MRARKTSVETFATGTHIKWSVLWVKPEKGDYTIIRKEFGNDLGEAVRVYSLAKAAGKKLATLRSNNAAFPPPAKYRQHTRKRVKVVKKVVRGNLKKSKVLETYVVVPMLPMNRKGWFWCPYCREMRKFQQQIGFPMGEKSFVEAAGIYCPLCGVSHRDFAVRKWNPIAERMYLVDTAPRSRPSRSNSSQKRTRTQTSRRRSTR